MDTVNGVYKKRIFCNQQNGYQIFSLSVKEQYKDKYSYGNCITCQGVIPPYRYGISLELTGEFKKNDYGWYFDFTSVKEISFDKLATKTYLSGMVKGLGESMIDTIINVFGADVYSLCMKDDAEDLIIGAGIPKKAAENMVRTVRTTIHYRELYEYLADKKGAYIFVKKIVNDYGEKAKSVLTNNPYEIGLKYGLSFDSCDDIAFDNGFKPLAPERVKALVKLALEKDNTSGNVFVDEKNIVTKVCSKLEIDSELKTPPLLVENCIRNNKLISVEEDVETNRVYSKYMWFDENNTAKQVNRLINTGIDFNFLPEYEVRAEEYCGITYAPEQKSAFELLKRSGVAVLTGGPGTGKTTVVKGLIYAYQQIFPYNRIRLCAPTGRAAQRMSESTGMEATTIHRLLEYKPYGDVMSYKNINDPIAADLIIVDEASMLDINLASILFSAVKSGSLILLVGDINQLQSVGPGDVLNDLIRCGVVPVRQLKKVYRQASTSYIVKNALTINEGSADLVTNDEFLLCKKDKGQLTKATVEFIKKYHDYNNPFFAQVLCPTHNGDGGVSSVNLALQELLNPYKPGMKQLKYGNTTFRVNDKIIMLRNNVEVGYYNGDCGIIVNVDEDSLTINIQNNRFHITKEMLDDIKLAYAMTIHKSQGSEFPITLITLPTTKMLQRNLLYTAVTRAKKKAIIVYEPGNIDVCVKRCDVGKRNSMLVERLRNPI